ncbi:NAD-dependent epimerase/dehydratase family protein [Actinomadura rayongensis]|uniref:NAD-dependent epimerase/dehydratase family protein n=1 Tax=Actinomadura rayongensis TaxID=1429076 RepID=A0A6I4WMX9_9ACTN|nr:NAD(P)-dependent oxidoreductase [Actinomadura rayongensis]MXQ68042.1 NAD-dependent epimerase/dehydratase family protein [Actinomadura rayongensis]
MTERLLITGAAGLIGGFLRPRLIRPGRVLRLLDVAPIPDPAPGEETVRADVTDLDALDAACRDVTAVVHLGGIPHEADWPAILHTNIDGTYAVLEAARRNGVPRVLLASSNHAAGFHPVPDTPAPDYLYPRPDTFYGVSKVAGEALGSLYHDRHGMDVLCLRIGTCEERPPDRRALSTWLSPGDCARLVEALLTAPDPGFRIVWGASANTRGCFSLDEARALGYRPEDDAEKYAASVSGPDHPYIGGPFAE